MTLISARSRQRGLGLVEMLVALSITAALLTAAAVAIDASLKAYSVNQTQADTLHRARIALHRISTLIRTGSDHQPVSSDTKDAFAQGQTVTDSGIELIDPQGNVLQFRFDSDHQRLLFVDNGQTYTLLKNVVRFQLRMTPSRSAISIKTGGGFDRLSRATLLLTLRPDIPVGHIDSNESEQSWTLSTSVTPRIGE
ncbi:MAG: hypothetical protein KatS3mg104_2068 [Phycisphaerae bacterium]|jgi:prepilin-type N-terminal cleavage/methylation domain-containing protein|nr:MAG: hypothetical protein KatS3mg104_2068 [Phycisphaerae bacterium]